MTNKSYRSVWTGRGQGVATDGTCWYVTQNDRAPGVSRYSADFKTLEARANIPRSTAGHVGAVSVHEDTVYVALENPELILALDRNLNERSMVPVDRPMEPDGKRHLSWLAINPENDLIYSCDWNHATRLDAYDPATGENVRSADIALQAEAHRSQGGVFSARGRVYLALDEKLSLAEWARSRLGPLGGPARTVEPGIHGFDARTGAKIGYVPVPTRPHFPHFEEIEGLGLGPMTVDGTVNHVHLSVLDKNHSWVLDDVHLKSYAVPDPDLL